MTSPDQSALPGYFGQRGRGDRLRLVGIREETTTYVSYDATFRSDRWLVTGVLNVPRGKGPFPAVVLAHGYIEPNQYFSGQGMTRERTFLSQRGLVAFHVDYRNHAGSDTDPQLDRDFHIGYSVDVLNAVSALRQADLPVVDERIALMGRSMGGSVVLRALTMAPGLVDAAVVHSSSSSWEPDNYRLWGPGRQSLRCRCANARPPGNQPFGVARGLKPHLRRPDYRTGPDPARRTGPRVRSGMGTSHAHTPHQLRCQRPS